MPNEKEFKPLSESNIPVIVCAANRDEAGHIICGARHWGRSMRQQAKLVGKRVWEQGFIDQYERFYTREEAWLLVQSNGQPFDSARNGDSESTILFSEGLY